MGGWVDGWMRVEGFVRAKRKFASQIFCSKLSIDGGMDGWDVHGRRGAGGTDGGLLVAPGSLSQ